MIHFTTPYSSNIPNIVPLRDFSPTSDRVRTSSTMNSKEEDAYRLFSEPSPRYYDENKVFQKSNLFRMLPKGIPVPPSGPSRRHNGDVDFSNYP
uniref:Serine/threonine protein kinase n=1 Tax=Solanum tuberosum TaxID=4113 RepID=M1BHN0_SOLTU